MPSPYTKPTISAVVENGTHIATFASIPSELMETWCLSLQALVNVHARVRTWVDWHLFAGRCRVYALGDVSEARAAALTLGPVLDVLQGRRWPDLPQVEIRDGVGSDDIPVNV